VRSVLLLSCALPLSLYAADATPPGRAFLEKHCFDCHDPDNAKGGLDLTALKFDTKDQKIFAKWVTVHDRIRDGEMPPKKRTQPNPADVSAFLKSLAEPLAAADEAREASDGRSTWRRLNRYEYENSLRDLLQAPWLQISQILPEDGESHRFNKVGDALDVSHVQMARYLSAAEYALREVIADQLTKPETKIARYYTRDQKVFVNKMKFGPFNSRPERATFPLIDYEGQPDVRALKAPITVGDANPAVREKEAMGVVASSYEPIELRFDNFLCQESGRYKVRVSAYSVWVGPGKPDKWWIPDLDTVSKGRRDEPVTISSETKPRIIRWQGSVDFTPEPSVKELDLWLLKNETIRVDAARLFRSRPPNWHNPLAEKDGQPGVAFRWLEVEGPIIDEWPSAGHKLLFGDLPLKASNDSSSPVEVVSADPSADAARLLKNFMTRAYRRPVDAADEKRFLGVIERAMKDGNSFMEAMIAGYSAVLCSPGFVCLEEKPGTLDDFALAARLSYFLWNTAPDDELRTLASKNELRKPEVLRAQTERLLNDARSRRFTEAFLNYWLDLRRMDATSPDAELYPDYYLDDLLVESALHETQLFFAELLKENLPASSIVAADFSFLNERLAQHYGIPGVSGVALRRVKLPPDSVRGGLMTQASVLKVTANGTTTSPVLRGAWIMERILGKPPPPPPPSVPAVEPDIRGATTIREQLDKHRTLETCASCHTKIDPPGFALENFDVMGGWREKYRAMGEGKKEVGFGKNGQPFAFHLAQTVDASSEMPGVGKFQNIRELRKLLLADERQLARNLVGQLTVYATGAPIRFGDRPRVEKILDQTAEGRYGVRALVHAIVQSELFRSK